MSRRVRWRFEPSQAPERLSAASDELDAALAANGGSERARFAARLVVEEIVLNAFEHGNAREVTLEADPGEDPLRLVFEDDGAVFDLTARHPQFDTIDGTGLFTRGRGLVLVRSLARHMEHSRADGRNRVTVSLAR